MRAAERGWDQPNTVTQSTHRELCRLVRQLTRRLGSSEFAYEALHETFLRLDRVTDAVLLRSPANDIFRTAINIAKDHHKAKKSSRDHVGGRHTARDLR